MYVGMTNDMSFNDSHPLWRMVMEYVHVYFPPLTLPSQYLKFAPGIFHDHKKDELNVKLLIFTCPPL